MARFKNITGQKFGRLTVTADAGSDRVGNRLWHCICDCGNDCITMGIRLRAGRTTSCGCYNRERVSENMRGQTKTTTHGLSGHYLYQTWASMKNRCSNSADPNFKYYGKRGIKVCAQWAESFPTFLAYVGDRPSPDHSLDRIDVDGDYKPGNVRWATAFEQIHNRRNSKFRQAAESLVQS